MTLFTLVLTTSPSPMVGMLTLVVRSQMFHLPPDHTLSLRIRNTLDITLSSHNDSCPLKKAVLVKLFALTSLPLLSADVTEVGLTVTCWFSRQSILEKQTRKIESERWALTDMIASDR